MIFTEYMTTIIDMHILCLTLYQLSKFFLYTIDNTLNIWKYMKKYRYVNIWDTKYIYL